MTAPERLHDSLDAGPPPLPTCCFCQRRTGFLAFLNGYFCCSRCIGDLSTQARDHRLAGHHAVEPVGERVKLMVVGR